MIQIIIENFAWVVFQFQPEQHCYIVNPVFILVKNWDIYKLVVEFKDDYSQSHYRTVDLQLMSIIKRQIVCMRQIIYSLCQIGQICFDIYFRISVELNDSQKNFSKLRLMWLKRCYCFVP